MEGGGCAGQGTASGLGEGEVQQKGKGRDKKIERGLESDV